MAQRLIRDGLLESEAVLSLSTYGRWLYVTILLSADDLGLFEATPFKLARRADMPRDVVQRELVHLIDLDLIRAYQGDGIRTFGFIPKFGQRLRYTTSKFPLPPAEITADDPVATKHINKIKDLAREKSAGGGLKPAKVSESRPEVEVEVEEKKKEAGEPLAQPSAAPTIPVRGRKAKVEPVAKPDGVDEQVWLDWLEMRRKKGAAVTMTVVNGAVSEAAKAGISLERFLRLWCMSGYQGFKASWVKPEDLVDSVERPASRPFSHIPGFYGDEEPQ